MSAGAGRVPVVAGAAGLAGRLAPSAAGDRAVVLVDAAVAGGRIDERVCTEVRRQGLAIHRVVRRPEADLASLRQLAERLDGAAAVVGVGGGSVIDQAKLACLLAGEPSAVRRLTAPQRCGLVALPASVRRRQRLVLVPTTVGTGSQVSPNACLEHAGRKRLVNGRALQPDLAVVDADATADLPVSLLVEGAVENLARLAGFYVGDPQATAPGDRAVEDLLAELVAIGDRLAAAAESGSPVPGPTRAALTALSGRSHDPDLVAGRALYVDRSWPLANELSCATGLRKVPALAALLGPLWRRVEAGDDRLGAAGRLHRLWSVVRASSAGELPAGPATGVAHLLRHWGVDPAEVGRAVAARGGDRLAVSRDVADRACRAWGDGLPMLRGLDRALVADLYAEALAAAEPRVPAPAPPPRLVAAP